MNTESTKVDTLSENPSPDLGGRLREKRESLGLSVRDVAEKLRLRMAVIESIEENDFQIGQVHTFTRGYVLSYAKLVGMDEKEALTLFDSQEVAKCSDHKMQSFSQSTQKKKHDNRLMKLTWGIFAIMVGISAIWWYQNEQNVDTVVSEPAPQTEESSDSVNPESEISEMTQLAESPEVVDDLETVTSDTETTTFESEASPQEATVEPEMSQESETTQTSESQATEVAPAILMAFTKDCWIKVTDASGKTLSTGVKKAGDTLELEGQRPFKFVIGAPEGLSLSISGEPVDLSGYTAGKVARFTAE